MSIYAGRLPLGSALAGYSIKWIVVPVGAYRLFHCKSGACCAYFN